MFLMTYLLSPIFGMPPSAKASGMFWAEHFFSALPLSLIFEDKTLGGFVET